MDFCATERIQVKAPAVDIRNVGFSFRADKSSAPRVIFEGFSLRVDSGSSLVIMGCSGVGKSTLAGLMTRRLVPHSGTVEYASVIQRPYDVTFVDQTPMNNVFPWQSVRDNIEYPLRKLLWSARQRGDRVSRLIELFRLGGVMHSFPARLSGGELQRLALARQLSWQPRIAVLDEVFTALDVETRACCVAALKTIVKEEQTTIVMITHSVSDAISMADRCIVLGGRPASAVCDFTVQNGNISEGVFTQTLRRAICDGYI